MSTYPSTARRTFLQRVSAGSLAILAAGGLNHTASAAPAVVKSKDWLDKITGKHRQVFDAVEPNDGFAAVYALNYVDSYKMAGVDEGDVSAVLVYRHKAMPLMLNDAMWAKYKIGEALGVTDAETEASATRNPFRTSIMLRPGLTYDQLSAERGVSIVVCKMALTVLSGMMAGNASVTAEEAAADWTANLIDGATLVPSGVYAVDQAQEKGCSYCYAG